MKKSLDSSIDRNKLVNGALAAFGKPIAIYLFGSACTNELIQDSDIDVAVLQDDELDASAVLEFKSFVSREFLRDTDVVDLMRADTVTIAEIVSTGDVVYTNDPDRVAFFNTLAYSKYALLNEERREILEDVARTGVIYAR